MAKLKHVTLPNGNNYDIYGVNVQEISYDDYEALTPTQKNSDIAYCITDTPYEVDDSIYGGASGAIASFDNGSANPLKSLVIDINPVQDLHGYSKPWAAGAGKNKLENTATTTSRNGLDFTVYPDGSVLVNGTATASTELVLNTNAVPTEGNYIISGCPEGGTNTTYWLNYKVTINGVSSWKQEYGSGRTENNATIQNVGVYIYNGAVINNLMFYPMIRLATETDATFAPYTNVCPITGRSSVGVTVAGTNIWDEEWEVGGIRTADGTPVASNSVRSKNFCIMQGGNSHYLSAPNTVYVFYYDQSQSYISYISTMNATITPPSNARYFKIQITGAYGTTYNNDVSINYPSTDTSYHAYVGTTETISLGQTVHGGKLNVTTGELTVDRTLVEYDGSSDETWAYVSSYGGFRVTIADANINGIPSAQVISNRFVGSNSRGAADKDIPGKMLAYTSTSDNIFLFFTTAITDLSEWKDWLSENITQVEYPLATPITISLTPTQVNSLLGNNNIWADSGDVDVVYITSDFIYNELRMNDTVIASNGFAYHSIESESATMAGHANTASNAQTVNGHTVNSDVPSNATFTDTTYTFTNGTNGFTVTPSSGTAQTVTVTPSISNNVTGSGTSGYLAKFNGANTITNGAQLGSDTTKFLRNDGTWAVPPGAGGGVTGVKGNAESTYRTGNVNLTPANLELESKPAASGGTDLSLVTTHEKYVWNNKATTDENVKQTEISTSSNTDYPILGGYPYDTSSPHIRGTHYSEDITITGHSLIIGATGASAAGYNALAIGIGGTYESMLCAGGDNSIAVGEHVCSSAKNQLVFGRWNREDPTVFDTHPMGIRFDHERNSSEGQYVEIVGNGTSLQNTSNARTLDWSGNEWLAGTLTASGATINGSISVSDNILSDDSSLDITTSAPVSDYWSQYGIYFRDTNQTEFGRVRGYYLTDGEVGVEYETKRTVGGTVKYNNLNLGIDSSGNNVVSVSSPSAWRTALGLKDWVEVDHKGGTTAIPIPSGITEICCVITVGNNTIAWTFTLPYAALSSTSWRYTNAYTSVSDGYIAVNVSTAQVSLNAVYNGKSNVTNSSILYLYAR